MDKNVCVGIESVLPFSLLVVSVLEAVRNPETAAVMGQKSWPCVLCAYR